MDNLNKVLYEFIDNRKNIFIAKESFPRKKHVPSSIQPDTLFTFTTEMKWLLRILEYKMLSPRYCDEDISYLGTKKIKKIAFPMKCFCDINLKKLDCHMYWYGNYGIAFEKVWGMDKGIQPVIYINEDSALREDLSEVFKEARYDRKVRHSKLEVMLKNYMLHQIMYCKPYQGKFENRNTGEIDDKCFQDECEWRFIPDTTPLNMPKLLTKPQMITKDVLKLFSDALDLKREVSLEFEYSDIKHIIIQNNNDYKELVSNIDKWNLSDEDKYNILSKVLVWNEIRGDL